MYEANPLTDALKRGNLPAAKELMDQGEKVPKDLQSYEKSQIYDTLIRAKAFELINALVKDGFIETDTYEYEKFDNTIFPSLFRYLGTGPADLDFLAAFAGKLDNINDAVQDKTLLNIAFNNSAPIEHIKILVAAGCDVNYKTNYEENYLYKIIQEYAIKEDTGVVYLEYLIGEGLDPNAGNIVKETPLHLAIATNKQKYIDLLLQHGADLNQPGKDGETPFYAAIVHQVCNVERYEKLAAHAPVDFDIANKNGETVFCGAMRMRRSASTADVALIKALIRDGADIYQTSPYYAKDKAAIDWLAEQPAEMLQGVLETGVIEIDRRDNEGNTLLHKVCAYNVNYEQEAARQLYRKVKLLIEQGADVNITNDLDQRPIDLASTDNLKSKTVELLLKHKA
ncbi:ankyrin repeat domain-containing protein [Chitinophaga polysaccharea]|uniref:ankyrin repeat domain-containing protein n=1 Tax=Chitinophaga polysaccharea TaxID=1293035 RepID=UPI0011570CA7|nr:ankyrin repeat domain-containing protein [Chitinophaga polysaccharea]